MSVLDYVLVIYVVGLVAMLVFSQTMDWAEVIDFLLWPVSVLVLVAWQAWSASRHSREAAALLVPRRQAYLLERWASRSRRSGNDQSLAYQKADLIEGIWAAMNGEPTGEYVVLRGLARLGAYPVLKAGLPAILEIIEADRLIVEEKRRSAKAYDQATRDGRVEADRRSREAIEAYLGPVEQVSGVQGYSYICDGTDEVVYLPEETDWVIDPHDDRAKYRSMAAAVRVIGRSPTAFESRLELWTAGGQRYTGVDYRTRVRAARPELFKVGKENVDG